MKELGDIQPFADVAEPCQLIVCKSDADGVSSAFMRAARRHPAFRRYLRICG